MPKAWFQGQSYAYFPDKVNYDYYNFPVEADCRAQARLKAPQGPLQYPDIEILFQHNVPYENEWKKMSAIVNWVRDENPTVNMGHYGNLPPTSPYQGGTDSWRSLSDQGKVILPYVNFVAPDLYFNATDYNFWRTYAAQVKVECDRVAPGKPAIPFVMFRYNSGADPASIRLQLIPPTFWRDSLNALYDLGFDGCIVWEYNPDQEWTASASTTDPNNWYKILKDFKTAKGI